MKKLMTMAASLLACLACNAAPDPYPIVIDSQAKDEAPPIQVMRANQRVIRITFKDNGVKSNIMGLTPFLVWATNDTASVVSTASCAVVVATNGTVDATFAPASINYAAGTYRYWAGLTQTNGTLTTYRSGIFVISGDPQATGAGPLVWVTNVNLSTLTFSGQLPTSAIPATVWSVWRAGTHGSGSNGWYAVDGTNTYWILHP